MSLVTTMDPVLWPLMDGQTIATDHCVICGRRWPLNQHHVVYRSQGQLVRDGRKVRKPTLTLCGSGNASGCHGLAHHHRLHFRYEDGHWLYLKTDEPVKYLQALEMDGWARLPFDPSRNRSF